MPKSTLNTAISAEEPMKSKTVSIKFKLGKREINLSPDEAREMYDQLRRVSVLWTESPFVNPVTIPALPQQPNPIYREPQRWPYFS